MQFAVLIVIFGVFLVIAVAALFIPPTIFRKVTRIPPDATSVGPDNYMHVWDDGSRINMVFRNVPHMRIRFDRRTAHEFADWLRTVPLKNVDV